MWFWYFWGISVIVCYLIFKIMAKAIANRLKREFSKEEIKNAFYKKSFSEFFISFLPFIIPFINILILTICVFSQEGIYEYFQSKIKKEKK